MDQKVATISIVVTALAVVLVFLFLPSPPSPSAPHVTVTSGGQRQASAGGATYLAELGSAITAGSSNSDNIASAFPQGVTWEDRLDQILTKKTDNATTVRGLLSSLRGLPPEAREEFVAHAVNLCEDAQFGLLGEIYLDAQNPRSVTEIIFNDVLNRPDGIKLPLLAKTLRNAAHPMVGEAKEILEMYLELEPGAIPPNGWEQAVDTHLKQQTAP